MADNYTPTTEDVRADYAYPWDEHHIGDTALRTAAFDRWLTAHDAAIKAEALTELAVVAQRWISNCPTKPEGDPTSEEWRAHSYAGAGHQVQKRHGAARISADKVAANHPYEASPELYDTEPRISTEKVKHHLAPAELDGYKTEAAAVLTVK